MKTHSLPLRDRPLTAQERRELIETPLIFQEFGGLPSAGHRVYGALERSWLRDEPAPEGADVMEEIP